MNKRETNFKLDFIGIGFPRSGTTWLANNIAAHPEVDFAKHKETNFFLTKNSEVFSKESLLYLSQMRPPDFKTYLNEFTHNGDIKGEFGVYYIYDRYALNLLKRKFPDIKVLICIRNPVDCLESSYYFVRSSHIGYTLNDNYLEEVLNSPNQLYSIERAKYYEHVRFCKHLFGDKLKIILFEDIKSNPEKVLKDVYKFLGVTNLFFPRKLWKKSKRDTYNEK